MGVFAKQGGGGDAAAKPPGGQVAVGSITIRFFSRAQDVVGLPSVRWEIADGETIASILDRLDAAFPELAPLRASLLVAVNYEYAAPDRALAHGDEVALIPPVQGG